MKLVALSLLCLIKPTISEDKRPIPDDFLGTWIPSHDENLNKLLEAKQYGWAIRQILMLNMVKKTFVRNKNTFNITLTTGQRASSWDRMQINKMFKSYYLDGLRYYFLFDRSEHGLLLQVFNEQTFEIKETVHFQYEEPFLQMYVTYNNVTACIYHYKDEKRLEPKITLMELA
ncbi:unnamed protein product [Bursaphelenchus okinawaensis]|uniref:Uncharacterized protein n=1 Tax=Bursaphelenchus okinawaensis TaxID=465554 RepID=A0A811KA89_9BILA|nr:unnamed protein product [Bursaphelenchus okinawaensis]CAG9097149.1 unnamed protein product [Bursaphelenchus okinawaensis]